MSWKRVILSNWKLVFLIIQLGLLSIAIATGKALADPIDDVVCPG